MKTNPYNNIKTLIKQISKYSVEYFNDINEGMKR